MKKFQAITRKVVSIKTFARRYSYVDDEIVKGLSLDETRTQSRDTLLTEVRPVFSCLSGCAFDELIICLILHSVWRIPNRPT